MGEKKKYHLYMIAGEPSGDFHGASLIRELQNFSTAEWSFEGLGGPEMAKNGMKLHFPLADYPIMGIGGVFRHFPTISRIYLQTLRQLRNQPPSALVLIDYPGFNLRVAAKAKKMGIPVIYYISPQIWAWWKSRIKRLPQKVDKMLVILPFEEDLFRNAGIDAEYVGHPTFDHLASQDFSQNIPLPIQEAKKGKLISLLPGSRSKEIELNLPIMLEVAKELSSQSPEFTFLIGTINEEKKNLIEKICRDRGFTPPILVGKTHYLMAHSYFAFVTSGTASLELTYFQTPMLVHYRVARWMAALGKIILSIPYFSLPNILAGREIVPEILSVSEDWKKVLERALPLLKDGEEREKAVSDLKEVCQLLSKKKGASRNAAQGIYRFLEFHSQDSNSKGQ